MRCDVFDVGLFGVSGFVWVFVCVRACLFVCECLGECCCAGAVDVVEVVVDELGLCCGCCCCGV